MAEAKQILGFVLALLVVLTWTPTSYCAKKPVAGPRKGDVPYIKCQVCEKIATQLYQQVQKKQAQISPKKISEYQIIEIAENVCNLKKEEADWITRIDIVEQGDKLELVEQDTEGICNSECKTIERACEEVMGYSDTDVAEYLYTAKPQIGSLVDYLCKDLTGSCIGKPPPLPKDRLAGEPFMPKPSKDAEMDKMLRDMQGMPGAPNMQMYSKDDLMNMKNFGDDGDVDEDEDEEEESIPSKLGKVLRESKNKDDWKEKIKKGVVNTGETLKSHARKISNRIQHWWSGTKAAPAKKKSKSGKSEL
ncbi:hypothetical protein HS088_TW09G01101 [Tripterygium wilfordii]|uniref:Saposin B-type domain-containing protein n=1 Tax=Tripterygium wilfordii TaxID=458696 RepID=A0A7J7D9W8_TRIWF|nr:uncharacterized protein LOC120005816 [Tripterygium wilfordii]KAF5743039.1 hypothetical protein HS088_TW09G01101 [Tripterygium wilfordii]